MKEGPLTVELLKEAKRIEFPDNVIARLTGISEDEIKAMRYANGINAAYKMVDTLSVSYTHLNPTGKMPITLPKDDSVIAVDADGVCISRNDIPGYLKDNYLPDSMKDENGKAYAYRDRNGNYYEMNFGLAYTCLLYTSIPI